MYRSQRCLSDVGGGLASGRCATVRYGESTSRESRVISMIIIIGSGLAVVAFCASFAIALGRAAGRADEELERLLSEEREVASIMLLRESYAGLARAQSTILRESSMTVPSSRTRVGTQRLPVSSCTSLRPRVWLNMPGNGANP